MLTAALKPSRERPRLAANLTPAQPRPPLTSLGSSETTPHTAASESAGKHEILILIVDEEIETRKATATLLAQHGYRTLTAEDGTDALTLYVQHHHEIQAVLTDVTMPVVDGVALCRALRKLDPHVVLIAAMDSNDAARRREIQALNLAGLLPKPFDPKRLLETVDQVTKIGGTPK